MSWSGITRTGVVVAVLLGTGVTAGAQAGGPENRAHLDAEATSAAKDAAASLATKLFTYTSADVEAHEATFARLTTGEFADEYDEVFGDLARMRDRQLSLTSTVKDAAVRTLHADRAEVLVFLDQVSENATTGRTTPVAGMFTATIQLVDGEWKFADLDLYEGR